MGGVALLGPTGPLMAGRLLTASERGVWGLIGFEFPPAEGF